MPRRINLIQVNVEPVLLTFVLINLFYFLHLLAHYFIFIERKDFLATIHENIDENFVQWRNLLARSFVPNNLFLDSVHITPFILFLSKGRISFLRESTSSKQMES